MKIQKKTTGKVSVRFITGFAISSHPTNEVSRMANELKEEKPALSMSDLPAGWKELPPNTEELLTALHGEFYGRGKVHADAFRILPTVIRELKAAGAIPSNVQDETRGTET